MEPTDMTIVEHYGSYAAAESQAAYLVERGVGATIESDEDAGTLGLAVLTVDAGRARDVLGLSQLDVETAAEDEVLRPDRAWLIPLLIFGAALLVIPIVAFLFAFKVAGG